jgi:hypothetical protein
MKLVDEGEVQGYLIDEGKFLMVGFPDSHRPMKDLGFFQEVIVKTQCLSRH